eukprot:UN02322
MSFSQMEFNKINAYEAQNREVVDFSPISAFQFLRTDISGKSVTTWFS